MGISILIPQIFVFLYRSPKSHNLTKSVPRVKFSQLIRNIPLEYSVNITIFTLFSLPPLFFLLSYFLLLFLFLFSIFFLSFSMLIFSPFIFNPQSLPNLTGKKKTEKNKNECKWGFSLICKLSNN